MLSKEFSIGKIHLTKTVTRLKVGQEKSIIVELDTKFNKLQKFMWKKFFNIEVEDVK